MGTEGDQHLVQDHIVEDAVSGSGESPRERARAAAVALEQFCERVRTYDADVLTQSRALAEYYEAAVREFPQPKAVSNWVMSELLRELPGDDERAIAAAPVPPGNLAGLLRLVADGTISGKIAKDVFERMVRTGEDAATIVAREGLTQVADTRALEALVDEALAANPRAVDDWKKGKTAAAKALVGQVMKASSGRANPAIVSRLVQEKLTRT